jgi:hypothetical protein
MEGDENGQGHVVEFQLLGGGGKGLLDTGR